MEWQPGDRAALAGQVVEDALNGLMNSGFAASDERFVEFFNRLSTADWTRKEVRAS
jgi:hypothetical protein